MYLWNVKALAQDLKYDRVTQKDFMYYYAFFLIPSLALPGRDYTNASVNYYIEIALICIINAVGLYQCFMVNQAGDNQKILERLLSLTVPLSIRIFITFVPIICIVIPVAAFLVTGNNKPLWEEIRSLFLSLTVVFIQVLFYLRLRKYIRQIANHEINIQFVDTPLVTTLNTKIILTLLVLIVLLLYYSSQIIVKWLLW